MPGIGILRDLDFWGSPQGGFCEYHEWRYSGALRVGLERSETRTHLHQGHPLLGNSHSDPTPFLGDIPKGKDMLRTSETVVVPIANSRCRTAPIRIAEMSKTVAHWIGSS
jgi:hypothetical protein